MDVQQVLADVGKNLTPNSIGDIVVYAIFLGCILTLAFLPDGNQRSQNLLFGTMLLCVLDLLLLQQALLVGGSSDRALFAFAVHVGMFIFPAICVGSIRAGKKKPGAAIMLALLTSVFGALYAFATFGTVMNPSLGDMFFR